MRIKVDGHRILPKCCYCGRANVEESRISMCRECSSRYAKYMRYKRLVETDPCDSNYQKLYSIIAEYKVLRNAGFKVPNGV